MKTSLLFIIILFTNLVFAQNNDNTPTHTYKLYDEVNVLNDTMFLYREQSGSYYHAVYIDSTGGSEYYKGLANFEFNDLHEERFWRSYNNFKEKYPELYSTHYPVNLPEDWVPVYPFRGKYYLYGSNWSYPYRRMITDSSLVFWSWICPSPNAFLGFEHEKNKWSFRLATYDTGYNNHTVNVYLLDNETGLSLFETYTPYSKKYYQLFIPTSNMHKFKMIINHSTHKQKEVEFDDIDFKALIEESSKKRKLYTYKLK